MLFLQMIQHKGKVVHLSAVLFQEGHDLLFQILRPRLLLQLDPVGGSLLNDGELGAFVPKQGHQLGVAVVSGVKLDELISKTASHLAQVGGFPFIFIVLDKGDDGLLDLADRSYGAVRLFLLRARLMPASAAGDLRAVRALFLRLPGDQVEADELVAGLGQGQRGFGLAHPDHIHLLLAQPHRQLGKIAVAGHQAEAVHLARIKDVHGVDHHGHVRGVLAGGIVELLNGIDGIFQQRILLPAVPLGPVPVDPAVGSISVIRDLVKNARRIFLTDVVRVDQHGKMLFLFLFVHISLHTESFLAPFPPVYHSFPGKSRKGGAGVRVKNPLITC